MPAQPQNHLPTYSALAPWPSTKNGGTQRASGDPQSGNGYHGSSVPVGVALERTVGLHADVVGLLFCELRELSTESWKVQCSHFLVQLLGQQVDLVLVRLRPLPVLEQVKLRKDLVGERARHHEGWVAGGTTQ